MSNPLTFAARLYAKFAKASRQTRDRLRPFLQDILASGAMPLGLRPDDTGQPAYWWLVYDASILSPARLDAYIRDHTPPGYKIVALRF